MKIKELRKKLKAGILCVMLAGNLAMISVQAAGHTFPAVGNAGESISQTSGPLSGGNQSAEEGEPSATEAAADAIVRSAAESSAAEPIFGLQSSNTDVPPKADLSNGQAQPLAEPPVPVASDSGLSASGASSSGTSNSGASVSGTSDSGSSASGTSDSGSSDSGTAVSGPSDFVFSDSDSSDSGPSDPGISVPAPSDPDAPEPGPSDPDPSDPTPTPPSGEDTTSQPSDGISISREDMKNPIKAGQEFPVIILLKNTYQNTAVTNVKLQLELPQGLSMNAEQITDTLDVKDIQPGQERKVKVKLIAGKLDGDIPTLIIKAKVSYDFTAGDQVKLGGSEKNILLPVSGDQGQQPKENPGEGEGPAYGGGGDYGGSGSGGSEKKHIDPMTPNIIISSYEYDKDLKAGQAFILKLVLLNTSRQNTIENLVMSVEAGEALSIEDSSNTTYIERLKPHETYTKEMRLKVLPQGALENAKLDISFKYEYLKKEERAQVTSTEKFAIRFSQPDRFSVGDIQKEKEIYANEEATVSIPYVNKGKTAVYNMEARMETGMTSEETYKFLGNVEPGTSGTIDFFVTALEPGKQKVKITLTYEDASGNEKTVEKEAELTVQEQNLDEMSGYGFVDEAMATDGDVNKAGVFSIDMLTNKAVMIPAVVVVLAFVVFMVRRKKKKRLQQEEEENF